MAFAHSHFDLICKRVLDVGLAAVGLTVIGPLMGLISLAVWLDSPGPVIFAQERLGQGGKRFKMYKFRKFPPAWGDEGPAVTARSDVRMTRVGSILEKSKLDELPQFWNILKGDMSFVGPRPELPRLADLFKGEYAGVLRYKPGLFGPNQVRFRNECESYPCDEDPEAFYCRVLFPSKVEADLDYFQKATCFSDLFILAKGLWVSLVGMVNWWALFKKDSKVIALDVLLISASWFLAHIFRFAGLPSSPTLEVMLQGFLITPPLLILAMAIGGCYRHPLHFFWLDDALRLFQTILVGWLLVMLLLIKLHRNISFYLLPIFLFILICLLALPRIGSRLRWERSSVSLQSPNRIVIYGAGRAGIAFTQLIGNGRMIGFLDDNPDLKGKLVAGRRVLGYESDIITLLRAKPFDELWLTFSPSQEKLLRLRKLCGDNHIEFHALCEIEPFSRILNGSR
jgi:lipopolysaccharide/colanic/teichoic acid biosynthesis glycosyltransferase